MYATIEIRGWWEKHTNRVFMVGREVQTVRQFWLIDSQCPETRMNFRFFRSFRRVFRFRAASSSYTHGRRSNCSVVMRVCLCEYGKIQYPYRSVCRRQQVAVAVSFSLTQQETRHVLQRSVDAVYVVWDCGRTSTKKSEGGGGGPGGGGGGGAALAASEEKSCLRRTIWQARWILYGIEFCKRLPRRSFAFLLRPQNMTDVTWVLMVRIV